MVRMELDEGASSLGEGREKEEPLVDNKDSSENRER